MSRPTRDDLDAFPVDGSNKFAVWAPLAHCLSIVAGEQRIALYGEGQIAKLKAAIECALRDIDAERGGEIDEKRPF